MSDQVDGRRRGRAPLPLGGHGNIKVLPLPGSGYVARCRHRDDDGVTRQVERRGTTKKAARADLLEHLGVTRGRRRDKLTAATRFETAATAYLDQVAEDAEDSTHDTYRYWVERVLMVDLGQLRLRECDVAELNAYFRDLARRGYAANTRRTLRAVLKGILALAVEDRVFPTNPVSELRQIRDPKGKRRAQPRGLTVEERRRFEAWLSGGCTERPCVCDDPKRCRRQRAARAADLPDIVRFGLGTGLRIGEICAVRWCDTDLDGVPVVRGDDLRAVPVVTVAGNVYGVKGKGLQRHDGKTDAALRVIPLPDSVVTMLRARCHGDEDPVWPLFATAGRNGPTARWPANVRRSLRAARTEVGLGWMTPHTWRRTYATILDDEMGFTDRMKADLMGQAKFLKDAYVSRGELHPDAAIVLDAALR